MNNELGGIDPVQVSNLAHRQFMCTTYLTGFKYWLVSALVGLSMCLSGPIFAGACLAGGGVDTAKCELPYDPFEKPTEGLGDTKISNLELKNVDLSQKISEFIKRLRADGVLSGVRQTGMFFDESTIRRRYAEQNKLKPGKDKLPIPANLTESIDGIRRGLQLDGESAFKSLFPAGTFDNYDVRWLLRLQSPLVRPLDVREKTGATKGWHDDVIPSNIFSVHTVDGILEDNIGTEYPADLDEVNGLKKTEYGNIKKSRFSAWKNFFSFHITDPVSRFVVPDLGLPPTTHRTAQGLANGKASSGRIIMVTRYEILNKHWDYPRLAALRKARFILSPKDAERMGKRLFDKNDPRYNPNTEAAVKAEVPLLRENYNELDETTQKQLNDRFNKYRDHEDIFEQLNRSAESVRPKC